MQARHLDIDGRPIAPNDLVELLPHLDERLETWQVETSGLDRTVATAVALHWCPQRQTGCVEVQSNAITAMLKRFGHARIRACMPSTHLRKLVDGNDARAHTGRALETVE